MSSGPSCRSPLTAPRNLSLQTGATSSSAGFAGSKYSKFNYPAVPYTSDNFHADCTPDDSNATSTWDCELSNLSDLATEQPAVRDTLRAYLQHLVSLGIGGFRLDSERSIPPADVAAILDGLDSSLYIYGEVWASSSGKATAVRGAQAGFLPRTAAADPPTLPAPPRAHPQRPSAPRTTSRSPT